MITPDDINSLFSDKKASVEEDEEEDEEDDVEDNGGRKFIY